MEQRGKRHGGKRCGRLGDRRWSRREFGQCGRRGGMGKGAIGAGFARRLIAPIAILVELAFRVDSCRYCALARTKHYPHAACIGDRHPTGRDYRTHRQQRCE
jgi:hypothetical protein